MLVYPEHMESTVREEMEKASFRLESEFQCTIVHHDKDSVQGQVLTFGKE